MRTHREENHEDRIVVQVDPDLEDLIPGFLENRSKDIESMEEALNRGDYETVRVLGHRMKGSGAGYGFDAISHIGRGLEQAASDQSEPEIRVRLRELATYLDRVEVSYG